MFLKIFITNILIYFLLFNQVFAQVLFSEIFPNTDDDVNLEYIELYNSGSFSQSLSGYILKDKAQKEYIFGTGEVLGSFEKKKFFRPQTKILLNNSNEELFLYNNSGALLDSFSYEESTNGEIIKILDFQENINDDIDNLIDEIDEQNIEDEQIIQDTDTNSGEILVEESEIDEFLEETEEEIFTGSLLEENNSHTGELNFEIEQEIVLDIPDVEIEVQSGIDYLTGNLWICPEKGEGVCKINLNIEKIFTGSYDISNYLCNWTFSGGVFSDGTQNKCNPGYVDYSTGVFDIFVEISDKNNSSNFKTGGITIQNLLEELEQSESNIIIEDIEQDENIEIIDEEINEEIDTNSGEIQNPHPNPLLEEREQEQDSNSGELLEQNISEQLDYIEKVVYSFQNPSYLLEKDNAFLDEENTVFNCDRTKIECRINLDFRDSFSGNILEKDYLCNTSFGFITGEEQKCNPNTITVPIGSFDFEVKIENKLDNSIFSSLTFKVINEGYLETPKSSPSSSSSSSSQEIEAGIYINKPEIIIQSGLDENNNCKKNDCKINLNYETKNKNELCIWDFSGGTFKDGTQDKCNPGYVDYPLGEYEVKLKVYQKNREYNYKESILKFSNKQITKEEKKEEQNQDLNKTEEEQKNEQEKIFFDYKNLEKVKIFKVMPNPKGTDTLEYIELINNSDKIINLKGCSLDDKLNGGSKVFTFKNDSFIKPSKTKKIYKSETKLNLNNDADEVHFFCDDLKIDSLSRNFPVKDGYYLNHSRLNIKTSKVKVIEVIDGDTLKVQFLDNNIVEKLRLIGVDTPETKHPKKDIEYYGIQAYNFTKNNLLGKEVILEIDPDNYRDKYSRLLGFVYLEEESFNKNLISLGYAKAYLDYDFNYILEYEKAEKEAKKQKLGIWGVSNDLKQDLFVEDTILIEKPEEQKEDIIDENNNGIPDEFEEFVIDENNTEELILDEQNSKEKYYSFVDLGFTQKVSKLKSGIKIYGKTIPNSKILLEIEEKKDLDFVSFFVNKTQANYFYELESDEFGDYVILITDFISGDFNIKTKIIDNFGNAFDISKNTNLILENDYIKEMQSYIYEKFLKQRQKYSDEVLIKNNDLLDKKQDKILKSIINLQGKIGTNKILNQNILTCIDTCSVNFDGSNSEGNIKEYIWNFGNNNTYIGKNPSYQKYSDFGYYKVSLKVIGEDLSEDISYFYINFLSKKDLNLDNQEAENIVEEKAKNNDNIKKDNLSQESNILNNLQEDDFKVMFFYILIINFAFILLFLLLRKEKII